jgi:hypothetical protein
MAEASRSAGVRLVGHQEVTDTYLLGLAAGKVGMLATLDQAVVALTDPKSPERKAIELVS